MIIFLFYTFRKFIKNVKQGFVFTFDNIHLLKKLSYGIAGFWLFAIAYMQIMYYYVARKIAIENVEVTSEFSNFSGILFLAIFIWVLAHIFETGLKLKEENELTI